MALDVEAVEAFTQGRLDAGDPETERQLDAALAAARRYCGWHVTPVLTDQVITLDGTGITYLVLPTLALGAVSGVNEDGTEIDVADLQVSPRGLIRKKSGQPWTSSLGSVTVTATHGYASAPDFEAAILGAIARGAFAADGGARVIGPFQYSEPAVAGAALFTDSERAILDGYALEATA